MHVVMKLFFDSVPTNLNSLLYTQLMMIKMTQFLSWMIFLYQFKDPSIKNTPHHFRHFQGFAMTFIILFATCLPLQMMLSSYNLLPVDRSYPVFPTPLPSILKWSSSKKINPEQLPKVFIRKYRQQSTALEKYNNL